MEIKEALEEFCLQLEADARSQHTRDQYSRHMELLGRWLLETGRSQRIEDIGHRDIAAFLVSDHVRLRADGELRKASSGNAIKTSLRVFFVYLHTVGHIDRNPAGLVRRAVCGPPPPRALSEEDQSRLLAALEGAETEAEKRDAVLFRLLLGTGARLGAVLKAEVVDFSAEQAELRLRHQKGGREGVVYLRDELVKELEDHIGDRGAGPLFPGQADAALTHRHAARRLQVWLERAGVERKASPHSLRHSFATSLYAREGDILLVKDALHHRSLASTLVYAQADPWRTRARMLASGNAAR